MLSALLVLHGLAVVVWVGGMAFAHLVLRPSLMQLDPPQRLAVWEGVFRRFFLIVAHAVPVVVVTGYAMLFGWLGGFRGVLWTVHAMNLLGLVMAGIFAAIWFGPYAAFRAAMAAKDYKAAAGAQAKIRQLVVTNLVLGVLTIAIALYGRYPGL